MDAVMFYAIRTSSYYYFWLEKQTEKSNMANSGPAYENSPGITF